MFSKIHLKKSGLNSLVSGPSVPVCVCRHIFRYEGESGVLRNLTVVGEMDLAPQCW